MANQQYVIANGDRSNADPFDVPGDEDGGAGDPSFRVEDETLNKSHDSYVHIDNGFNENVDVTVRGSHFKDEQMDSASDDGSAVTVNAGTVDFFDITSSHTYIEVDVNPAANPTSGNLVITFQSREA
jgi:hypothetical protein